MVPHQHDLAVVFREPIDRGRELALQFVLDRLGGRRAFRVDERSDERDARFVGPGGAGRRLLAIDAATLGQAMPAMRVDDAVLSEVPEPEMERHVRVLEIFDEPQVGFE